MSNKNILLVLIPLISASLFAAEAPMPQAPAQQPASYIMQLPPELQNELLQYTLYGTGYPDINAFANIIIAHQDKITSEKLIAILESLPTAIALELTTNLKNLPLMQKPLIINWIEAEKTRFTKGQELYDAAAKGQVDRIKNLLANKNINVNWRNPRKGIGQGLTPLLRVVSLAFPEATVAEIVDMLLKAGANPNLASETQTNRGTNQNWTALMVAAGKGNEPVVSMLLKAKAHVNTQDIYGDTALIEAAQKGHTHIVQMLLDAGANPDISNLKGETADMLAKNPETAQLLKETIVKRTMEKQ